MLRIILCVYVQTLYGEKIPKSRACTARRYNPKTGCRSSRTYRLNNSYVSDGYIIQYYVFTIFFVEGSWGKKKKIKENHKNSASAVTPFSAVSVP